MNHVSLIGRLANNLELKIGNNNNTAFLRFSIAVNNPFKKDEADFINCVAFNKTAELMDEYLKKGDRVALEGALRMNRYEANGEKRVSYEVVVEKVHFINDGKKEVEKEKKTTYPTNKVDDEDSDDFPF